MITAMRKALTGRNIVIAGLLILLAASTVLTYLPTLQNGFTNLDDPALVMNNRSIRGLSLHYLRDLFSRSYGGLGGYTPLVLLSYAIEYHFFGLEPRAFHATNLILHVLNALLIFWLMALVTGSLGAGFITALAFSVHPLHVEPVAWVQGRKDLLFSLFYLSGLMAYLNYIKKGRKAVFFWGALLLFALALFAKVTAISFPLVILLLEKRFAQRIDRRALIRSIPFWLMGGLFFALSFMTRDALRMGTFERIPSYWKSLGTLFYAFAFYVGKVFAPVRLFPGYQTEIGHDPGQAVLSFAALAILAALLLLAYRRQAGRAAFGVGFAVLTLLPTLPFHLFGQPYEDRYMYLPLAGLVVALTALFPPGIFKLRPLPRTTLAFWPAIIVMATLLGGLSWRQSRVWRDSLSLWSHAVKMDPANPFGLVKRGEAFEEAGRLPEALSDYRRASALRPENAGAAQHMGSILFKQGDYRGAMTEYDRSLALNPLFSEGYLSRGILWGRLGDFDKAIVDLTVSIRLNETSQARYYRALAYRELQKNTLALEDLRAAYRLEPRDEIRDMIEKWTPAPSK